MILDPIGMAQFGGTEEEAMELLLAIKRGCCHDPGPAPCDTGCETMKLALDQHFLDMALFLRRYRQEAFPAEKDGVICEPSQP